MSWTKRVRFIAAIKEDQRGNFTQLCARFGISRAQGYKWVSRYNALGPAGLDDRKPIPGSRPHRTEDAMVDAVIALRKQHPFDGPKKLREQLLKVHPRSTRSPGSTTLCNGGTSRLVPRSAHARSRPHVFRAFTR